MRIDRATLVADLNQFVRADSGVIVGGPGVGKSYALGELGDQLDAQGTAYLFLMIDTLGEVAEADLRRELGYEGTDLIASLAATDLLEEKGILIIDGYDAARNERTQKNALELIRRARQELRGKWNVVVSVRTYDARKSPELLDLFGKEAAVSECAVRRPRADSLIFDKRLQPCMQISQCGCRSANAAVLHSAPRARPWQSA
jgi:hypothetical protein